MEGEWSVQYLLYTSSATLSMPSLKVAITIKDISGVVCRSGARVAVQESPSYIIVTTLKPLRRCSLGALLVM